MGDRAGATIRSHTHLYGKDGDLIDYEPELLTGLPGEFESFHRAIREGLPYPVPAERCSLLRKSSMPSMIRPDRSICAKFNESSEIPRLPVPSSCSQSEIIIKP